MAYTYGSSLPLTKSKRLRSCIAETCQAANPSLYQALLGLMTRQYDIQGSLQVTHTCTLCENGGCKPSIISFIAFRNNPSLCLLFPNGNRKQMRIEWHLMCTDGGAACKFLHI